MYPSSIQATLRPGFLLLVLLLVSLGSLWHLALNAAEKVDQEVSYLTRHMLESQLKSQQRDLAKNVGDYAVWNEMYENVHGKKPNITWLATNLTASIYQNLGVDIAMVIDRTHGPQYTLLRGTISPQPNQVLSLDADQWQHLLRQADRYDHKQQLIGPSMLLRQVYSIGNQKQPRTAIYLAAIQRITPEFGQPEGTQRYLLFARELEPRHLRDMAQKNGLKYLQLNFSATPHPDSYLILENHRGQRLAYLEWAIDQPGNTMLRKLMPQSLFLIAFMLLLGMLIQLYSHRLQQRYRQRSQRLALQGDTLQQLVAARYSDTQTLEDYLDDVLPMLAQTLGTSRISMWRYSPDGQTLNCLAGVDTYDSLRFSGQAITLTQHPDYFSAINNQRFLASNQVLDDERLRSMSSLLASHNVTALLDASIMLGGLQHGILCAESRTDQRSWQQEEINFICAAANVIALVMESSARLQAEGELYRQFYYDRFTGLPNRSRLQMQLDELIQQQDNQHAPTHPIGCMMLSLEGLANINELYGRHSGDQLIRLISERLEKLLTKGEMVARPSDNRFVMLLLDEDERAISQRVDRLHEQLQQPLILQNEPIFIRIASGLSIYPYDTPQGDNLLEHAELALQLSRADPAANWVRFRPEMNESWRRRHRIQNDLRQAISRDELELHYQPYVALDNGTIAGAEALIRWNHAELGRIAPADFIPQAEENGQIKAIGEWALQEAIRQTVHWRAQHDKQFRISVNVSLLQLEDPRFAEVVTSLLATEHLPGEALELEVTEGLALRNTPAIDSNLQKLRTQGISIAIDDFGTGYASFSYLRRFPAEKLKIDKAFVDQVPGSAGSNNLVRMIVAMGHTLGASITGEGIEDIRQARFLAENQCDFAQGYLISKPLSAADMTRFLSTGYKLKLD